MRKNLIACPATDGFSKKLPKSPRNEINEDPNEELQKEI
jgi:hypothetical protein